MTSRGTRGIVSLLAVGLLASTEARAFLCTRAGLNEGPSLYWDRRDLTMQRSGVGLELRDPEAIDAALAASMAAWNDVDCSDIELTVGPETDERLVGFDWEAGSGSTENHNILVFRSDASDDPLEEWLHGLGDIAITTVTFESNEGRLLDADIEMNDAAFNFTACDRPGCRTEYDVQNTLTHEIGHVLGLDHSVDVAATMFASAAQGDVAKRTLDADDEDAICLIYPEGGPAGECYGVERGAPPDVRFTQTVCGAGGRAGPVGALAVTLWIVPVLRRWSRTRRRGR